MGFEPTPRGRKTQGSPKRTLQSSQDIYVIHYSPIVVDHAADTKSHPSTVLGFEPQLTRINLVSYPLDDTVGFQCFSIVHCIGFTGIKQPGNRLLFQVMTLTYYCHKPAHHTRMCRLRILGKLRSFDYLPRMRSLVSQPA